MQDKSKLETLFSNITEIYKVTVTLFDSLKDIMETVEEKQMLIVGMCFEQLAETAELRAYIRYVRSNERHITRAIHITCINFF